MRRRARLGDVDGRIGDALEMLQPAANSATWADEGLRRGQALYMLGFLRGVLGLGRKKLGSHLGNCPRLYDEPGTRPNLVRHRLPSRATLALDDVVAAECLLRLRERAVRDDRAAASSRPHRERGGATGKRLPTDERAAFPEPTAESQVRLDDRATLLGRQRRLRRLVTVQQEQVLHFFTSSSHSSHRRSAASIFDTRRK